MSLFLCCVKAPFKLALLNWMPLDKHWLEKKNDQKSPEKYIKQIPSGSANHNIFGGWLLQAYHWTPAWKG